MGFSPVRRRIQAVPQPVAVRVGKRRVCEGNVAPVVAFSRMAVPWYRKTARKLASVGLSKSIMRPFN
nr:hypothetical protein [Candidatus Sigynarchaeum springense]